MMPLEKKILNSLLDSYEHSKLLRGENKVAVHIDFPFNTKTIPEYFDESSSAYEDIHALLAQLEQRGFIIVVWKNRKVNHIVQKVILCEEAIPCVYRHMKRTPKLNMEESVLELLNQLQKTGLSPCAEAFVMHMDCRIRAGQSVKKYMDIGNLHEVQEVVCAVDQTERNEEECFLREFSIRIFHDSKRYEQISGKVCNIIREENVEVENFGDEELLSEYQIYHTPSYVYLKGQVLLEVDAQVIDMSVFPQGIGFALNNQNLKSIRITADRPVHSIYTIENLTSFFRFEREHSLIVYLGGYHNHARRALLEKIYGAFPDSDYYHFGDIDAGGFQIYHHLKEKTGIPFELYQMDLQTLKLYEQYGKKLTENDRKRLQKMRTWIHDTEEIECMNYMLTHNVKLEQECITGEDQGSW